MDGKLMLGRDCIPRAKDTESWIPKSAQELMKLARATVDELAEIPTSVKDEVVQDLAEAFVMVLLAGGNERSFARADYGTVEEDFWSLTRAFWSLTTAQV